MLTKFDYTSKIHLNQSINLEKVKKIETKETEDTN